MVLGSLLGGVLAGSLGWESVFFVNVPLAVGGAGAAVKLIPHDHASASRAGLDVPGALTSTAGTLAVVYGVVQAPEVGWTSLNTIVPLGIGAVLLLAFIGIERRTRLALVPLKLFRDRGLLTGTATTFLFMASFGAIPYFLTIYLQRVEDLTAFVTGLIFMLPSACVLLGTMIGGKLANSYTSRQILLGAWAFGGVGIVVLAVLMNAHGSLTAGAVVLALLSLAQGVVFTIMFGVSTAGVPAQDQGVASGIATAGQQVGGALGLAVLVAVASAVASDSGTVTDVASHTSTGMFAIAALSILGVLVAVVVPVKKVKGESEALTDTSPSFVPDQVDSVRGN